MCAIILLLLAATLDAAKFPPNFLKCAKQDTKCITEAAQNGIQQLTKPYPQVNLPNLEPLVVKELKIGAGAQGVVAVDQNFENCDFYGLNKLHFDDFGFDFEKKVLHAKGVIPELVLNCDYELNGKVLLLPIVGKGDSVIKIKNVKFDGWFDFTEHVKKSQTYISFTSNRLSLDPESVFFNFENLFNGDKALGDNINRVLNENNKEVFDDVRKGYEEAIGQIGQQILGNLFAKVSEEEAFL